MHLSAQWKAGKRAEDVITEWEPIMGNMVEVFFPTKRRGSMEEKHFLEEQERNIERGSRYGLRQGHWGRERPGSTFLKKLKRRRH